MKTVRISNPYTYPDLRRQLPDGTDTWEDLRFVFDDQTEADLTVVIGFTAEDLHVPNGKKNTLLLIQEPPIYENDWMKKQFADYGKVVSFWKGIGNNLAEQSALPWHVNKGYSELSSLKAEAITKADRVSWITSKYSHKSGQRLRLDFLKYLQQVQFDFDLFGKGFQPIEDKFDGIAPYRYSLALENYATDHYWTEKIADCYLSWTMPVYYGCRNIFKYFPEESMIHIDPKKPAQSLEKIQQAIADKAWEKHLDAIGHARQLILNQYQLFPWIKHLAEKYQLASESGIPEVIHPVSKGKPGLLRRALNRYYQIKYSFK